MSPPQSFQDPFGNSHCEHHLPTQEAKCFMPNEER